MDKNKIKTTVLSLTAAVFMLGGLSACDTGTEPGETDVGRGEIVDEGELVGDEDDINRYDVPEDSLEQHYDHADHQNHEDNDRDALGDGAYDGEGEGITRDEVQE